MATLYCDYEGGNNANNGTSFALRKKTLSGFGAADLAPGDTIRVMASKGRGALGINATWTNKSDTVTLASALNLLVDDGEAAWTPSANVTATADATFYRAGTKSSKLDIAAGFATGLVAYKALAGATDYSGYQGLTLWVYVSAALAASTLSLRLCSDAAGVTTVDTLALPAISVSGAWVPIYLDNGAALGASIQSIALYADLDPGTISVYLDNINTVKASSGTDNLNLTSLLSKNTAGEGWWAIRSISGTTVKLDCSPRMTPSSTVRGYSGTTETVATYKTDTTQTIGDLASVNTTVVQQISDSGTAGNLITISGGWNRTDMTTQTGETWFDGMNGYGYGLSYNFNSYVKTDKVNLTRYYYGLYWAGTGSQVGTCYAAACTDIGIVLPGVGDFVATTLHVTSGGMNAFSSAGISLYTSSVSTYSDITSLIAQGIGSTTFIYGVILASQLVNIHIGTLIANNCADHGFRINATAAHAGVAIDTLEANDNVGTGVSHGASDQMYGWKLGAVTTSRNGGAGFLVDSSSWRETWISALTAESNTSYGLSLGPACGSFVIGLLTTSGNSQAIGLGAITNTVHILASSLAEATKVYAIGSGVTAQAGGQLVLRNFNGTAGDHRTYWFSDYGRIFSATDQRHTASGISWKFSPTNTVSINAYFPMRKRVARIAVNAASQVTVSIYVRRDNTGITAKLVVPGRQIAGVNSDVVATAAAIANTWELLTCTFTPSETGVVEAEVQVYGGSSYNAWIDDLAISQV